jgi:hypothetical protein
MALVLDVAEWASQQFGACELGDARRTKRLVKLAKQMATKPDASTPQQTETWADCKAAYRLFASDQVTFEAVVAPHCEQTLAAPAGEWLIINDTTEINLGHHRELSDVGRVGSLDARGFYLHTGLMISSDGKQLRGLAAQDLYQRPLAKLKRVGSAARKKRRQRETDVWGRVIDRVGPPPEGARFTHVCDRGADNFEVFCHCLEQRADWIIRAAQLHRVVKDSQGQSRKLNEILREAPLLGCYHLQVRANNGQPARTARLEVRAARIVMPRPKSGVSKYVRGRGIEGIPMTAVEVLETGAPRKVTPLRWVLLTSHEADSFDAAWKVIENYEQRPLVEDYHKCAKTGCRVEERLFRSGDSWQAAIGVLSVIAVRLLQLKMVAREQPDLPAAKIVPPQWLAALPQLLKPKNVKLTTVREFFRGLARLGGFLARKGDGEPGWQTIWHGLETLLLCLRGATTINLKCG